MVSVLIVDDEARIRALLVRWLSAAGYALREARNAETALTLLAGEPADVVWCDVQMPGQGGLWLVQQIREKFPEVAIVLATALDIVPPSIIHQDGVVDYLVKPFDHDRVIAATGRAAEWHRAALRKSSPAETQRTAAGDPIGGPPKWPR
jgi:DNA-binding NtrC family response regulator